MPKRGAVLSRKWTEPEGPPPSLGAEVCDWMETYLVHGPGPIAGKPYRMHEDLRRFYWQCYELTDRGERLHDEAVIAAPKGYAKSEGLGALVCVEALGPCRFDGWDSRGDPVARPLDYVEIEIYAAAQDQTDNCYGNVAYMLGSKTCSDALGRDYGAVDIGRHEKSSTRVILPGHRGQIEPQTSRPGSHQGGKPTFVGTEELHEWTLPGMHQLYELKVKDLLKGRSGWVAHATNWFGEGEDSVLERLHGDWAEGAAGLLWFGRSLPEGMLPGSAKDATDADLEAALKWVYGSAYKFVNSRRLIDRLRRKSEKEAQWRRLFLSQPLAHDTSWMTAESWRERAATPSPRAREPIGVGFVGTDRCAAIVTCGVESHRVELVALWEDVEPPILDVHAAIDALFAARNVARLLANPWGWLADIDAWAGRHGAKRVMRFPVREDRRMRLALDRWSGAGARWTHVPDERLTRHALAARTRTILDRGDDGSIARVATNLEPKEPHLWIVAAQATLLAHEAACQAGAAPTTPPRKPAVPTPPPPSDAQRPRIDPRGSGIRASNRLPGRRL